MPVNIHPQRTAQKRVKRNSKTHSDLRGLQSLEGYFTRKFKKLTLFRIFHEGFIMEHLTISFWFMECWNQTAHDHVDRFR